MSAETGEAQSVRFEVLVNGPAYRSLLNGFRQTRKEALSSRLRRNNVRAEIEFDLESKQFSLLSVDRHSLPRSLSVAPGSTTHKSLSRLLALQAEKETRDELAWLFKKIVSCAPELPDASLTILQRDIEISFSPSKRTQSALALQLTTAIAPTLTLELDDTPTLVVPEPSPSTTERAVEALAREARQHSRLTAFVEGNTAYIEASVVVPSLPAGAEVEIFVHWGSYNEAASSWRDELVGKVAPTETSLIPLHHTIRTSTRGYYGATIFVQIAGTSQRIWLGRLRQDDLQFWIDRDDADRVQQQADRLERTHANALTTLLASLTNEGSISEAIGSIRSTAPFLGIGYLLQKLMEDTTLAAHIEQHDQLQHELTNLGLSEVVFATPEGPHAAAGGLAQVISGLPPELAKAGIPVTVIAPLYAYQNGSKHQAAHVVLEKGFAFLGKTVVPSYIGTVDVHLGPTYHTGTTHHRRPATTIPVAVYVAEFGTVRFFLLANSSVFDRLYQPVFVDEQFRRALVLSRATLEVIATRHFGIRPSALISNDWMTACIPPLAALDDHYRAVPWLKECKTVHMIHNGGADYHGRLPVNTNNEDLWPMMNLGAEHFFGFRDPHRNDFINFTMAASQHVSGGVVTVSQPYARQIVSWGGGDGLEHVLEPKRGSVFGISNGINRAEIERYLAHLANTSPSTLSTPEATVTAKCEVKTAVQETYGLTINPSACLISCVGRMVEQKGLSLLSDFVHSGSHSALEDVLIKHPDVQLLFAGPLTNGDPCASNLADAVSYLRQKYPGRVTAHFDYVAHSEALRIIFASTFFLMPSRFEPGGITQLEALAAGTLVIGRNVGGISATITNFDAATGQGNGFLCNEHSATAFANTASWAVESIRDNETYLRLIKNALDAKHSWEDRVETYQAVLQQIVLGHTRPSNAEALLTARA